ncbi:hypothetical protein [Chryseobacterium hagamense]|uniref:Uncharacterized protein n=1 Tax=Chryseobacterium hagamense TaxID=395935 RepID=A0A511YL97_9FLAO|nr:hypothetical protein [Chryseobacterium hagamense]GEN75985.1 hypothetical protein CHA01nite_17250 [Chryseobacterium hagamense]
MATSISYENEFEKAITLTQMDNMENYIKVFSVDGLVKRKEEHKKGELIYLIYYKDTNESIANILSENNSIRTIEIRERQVVGSYVQVNESEYVDGVLSFRGISVFDSNGNEIYTSPIDVTTNQHDYEETNKYFYDDNNKKLYIFWYGTNGQFSNMMSYNPNHSVYLNEFKQEFLLEDLPGLVDFDWASMGYYHSANPIIPT